MNKWIIPSKSLLTKGIVLGLLTPGGLFFAFYLFFFYYQQKELGYVNIDLYIACFGIGVPLCLVMLWIVLLFFQHFYMATRIFKITNEGIVLGMLRPRFIKWEEFTEIGLAPIACRRLRTYYFSKPGAYFAVYLMVGGDSNTFSEFGIFSMLLVKYYKFLGEIGMILAEMWLSSQMKNEVKIPRESIPRTLIWCEIDYTLYREIQKHIPNGTPEKTIGEKGLYGFGAKNK